MPAKLPDEPQPLWTVDLLRSGLGGIAATSDYVIFGDRDTEDFQDTWRCYHALTGEKVWDVSALAIGKLDYGNSPRATPLMVGRVEDGTIVGGSERVYLLGAFGDLLCVKLSSGEIVWQINLQSQFEAKEERSWGYCSSPLLAGNKLIVNPGAKDASLVALNPETGKVIWKTPGNGIGHGSFIVAELGGKEQIVGHDAISLGGWDIETGKRLWTLAPKIEGDFNVPTPRVFDGKLLITTENNGTRLYGFDDQGKIIPQPVAMNDKLHPDMSTPILVGDKLFCINQFLYTLNLQDELKELKRVRDRAFGDYAATLTDGKHVLVIGNGQVLLIDAEKDGEILSRWQVFEDRNEILSHAAVIGDLLYLRGEKQLVCLPLK